MPQEIISTKQALGEELEKSKGLAQEAVTAFTAKIENQEDLEKIAERDLENLKDDIEYVNEQIVDLEAKIAALPESPNEDQEMQEFENIKHQLSTVLAATIHGIQTQLKEHFEPVVTEPKKVEEKSTQEKMNTSELSLSGRILDPELLNKIAQLEAIDRTSFQFNQETYDRYIEQEQQGKHGDYSVTRNQQKIEEALLLADTEVTKDELEDALYDAETIYGEGGWNRYAINTTTGKIELASTGNATNTTGSVEYFTILKAKAKELGLDL